MISRFLVGVSGSMLTQTAGMAILCFLGQAEAAGPPPTLLAPVAPSCVPGLGCAAAGHTSGPTKPPTIVNMAPLPSAQPKKLPATPGVVTPGPPATSTNASAATAYTFRPTQYGTIQISQNGKIISTATPQYAAQAYGYKVPANAVPGPAAATTPAVGTSAKIPTGAPASYGSIPSTTASQSVTVPSYSAQGIGQANSPVPSKLAGGTTAAATARSTTPPVRSPLGSASVPPPSSTTASTIPQQTAVQRTAALQGAGLTPTQQQGVMSGAGYSASQTSTIFSVVKASTAPQQSAKAGTIAGTLTLQSSTGKTVSLDSYSNGVGTNEGTKYGSEQCVALVAQYATKLGGFTSANMGPTGQDSARYFAAASGRQFSYINNGSAPPTVGSVISISGWPSKTGVTKGDSAGHVGIAQSVTFNATDPAKATQATVTLFDQNMPGSKWTTVNFEKTGNTWSGSMIDNPEGTKFPVPVSGWANPT